MSRPIKKSVDPITINTRLTYTCVNCKHEWHNRSDYDFKVPKICPVCKSQRWYGDFELSGALLENTEVHKAYNQLAARILRENGERSKPKKIKEYLKAKIKG